jgi:hypothetical protein
MQKEVQDVETQLQEVLVSVKKLAKERECKYFVLATELYNLFPEIKVLRPQLKIDNFLETDGLEKETRSIDNYEELVELKVDAGVRHKLFKGKWDGHECVLKQTTPTHKTSERSGEKYRHWPNWSILTSPKLNAFFLTKWISSDTSNSPFMMVEIWVNGATNTNHQTSRSVSSLARFWRALSSSMLQDSFIAIWNLKTFWWLRKGPKIADLEISKDRTFGNQSTFIGGTVAYISPEAFTNSAIDFKSDMYSFGLIVYELYFPGQRPHVSVHLHTTVPLQIPESCSDPKLRDLLNKLLVLNPTKRLNAKEALAHPFFLQNPGIGPQW